MSDGSEISYYGLKMENLVLILLEMDYILMELMVSVIRKLTLLNIIRLINELLKY